MKHLFAFLLFLSVIVLSFAHAESTQTEKSGSATEWATQGSWFSCSQEQAWCKVIGSEDSEILIRVHIQRYFQSMEMESVRVMRYAKCEREGRLAETTWMLGEKHGLLIPCSGATESINIPGKYLEELEPLPPKVARLKKQIEALSENNLIL